MAETVYVDTGSASAGGNGTTSALTGANRAFKSWREALVAKSGLVLSQDYIIRLRGSGGPDTLEVTQAYWNFETPAPWRCYCIADVGFRHPGVMNGLNAYVLQVQDKSAIYNNFLSRVTIDGVAVIVIGTTTGGGAVNYNAFRLATANNIGVQSHKFRNCYARLIQTGNDKLLGFIDSNSASGGTCERENCIVYGEGGSVYNAFQSDGSGWAIANLSNLNCTSYNCLYGYLDVQICKNCIGAVSPGQDFLSTGTSGHENNASSDASAGGTNARINKTFSFINPAGEDFGLLSTDVGAKGFGKDLSGLFTDDAAGRTRTVPWDIGARMYYVPVSSLGRVPWSAITGLTGITGGGGQ